ncbi:hypothetical protein OXX69_012671, partial [Metschnikowia pulcherrima]
HAQHQDRRVQYKAAGKDRKDRNSTQKPEKSQNLAKTRFGFGPVGRFEASAASTCQRESEPRKNGFRAEKHATTEPQTRVQLRRGRRNRCRRYLRARRVDR